MDATARQYGQKPGALAILLHLYFLAWGVCSIAFQTLLWLYARRHEGDDTLVFVLYLPMLLMGWIVPSAGIIVALLGWRHKSLLVLAAICALDLLVFLSAFAGILNPDVADSFDWVVRVACLVLPLWWFFRLRPGRFPDVETD